MKSLSEFINLSPRDMIAEIERLRIPAPNPELRKQVREVRQMALESQADREASVYMEGFVDGVNTAMKQLGDLNDDQN